MDELRVLSPTAILGYGFPQESFARGMSRGPHLIAVDAGSTDPGPYYLGSGESFTSRANVKRDLSILLQAAIDSGIPLLIGSAGGAGARPHVEWAREIIEEISVEKGLAFRLGIIYADIPPSAVLQALRDGRVRSLGPAPELREDDIADSVRIVSQMGVEPVLEALRRGCQVVLAGRCYDPVPFAATAIGLGFDPGLALHMGKILECAAIAATPGSGSDCVLGVLHSDRFELESLNPVRGFTVASTAAHSLYEKSDPYWLPGPGGTLDLRDSRFTALPGGRVSVSGTRFEPSDPYTLKLEGVRRLGFRTVCIAGVRDPLLIEAIDGVLEAVRREALGGAGDDSELRFHVYGKNAVMGPLEPVKATQSHELGVVVEATASDQEVASALCAHARSTLLHFGYPGRQSTAGNLAMLYSPSDIPCGEVFAFSIYHLMAVEDPAALFPLEVVEVRQ